MIIYTSYENIQALIDLKRRDVYSINATISLLINFRYGNCVRQSLMVEDAECSVSCRH